MPPLNTASDEGTTPLENTPNANPKLSKKSPTTPRRTSAAKNSPNSNGNNKPMRKTSANKVRPILTSGPTRSKPRKQEPTLLGDFLMGRPSPSRLRRKSLDVVKKELRQEAIVNVRQPGGVKDRVERWQQASAATAITKESPPNAKDHISHDMIVIEVEESSADEDLKKEVKHVPQSPAREERTEDEGVANIRERSKSAPRKRVVSDNRWLKKPVTVPTKQTPPTKNGNAGTTGLEGLISSTANLPIDRKIRDWVNRMEGDEPAEVNVKVAKKPKRAVSRRKSLGDGIRVFPSRSATPEDKVQITHTKNRVEPAASRSQSLLDGNPSARQDDPPKNSNDVKPQQHSQGPVHRTQTSSIRHDIKLDQQDRTRQTSFSIGGVEEARATESKNESSDDPSQVPKVEQTVQQPSLLLHPEVHRRTSCLGSLVNEHTPSYIGTEAATVRPSTANSQLEALHDVPFGNSAFSVLDLPLGADAHTMRTTMKKPNKAQRAPSFRVANVLKKVYTESIKIMYDTVDPPLVGVDRPPSIESWLKNTTDPFVDVSSHPTSASGAHEDTSRKTAYNTNCCSEGGFTAGQDALKQTSSSRTWGQNDEQTFSAPSIEEPKTLIEGSNSASKPAGKVAPGSPVAYPDLSPPNPSSPTGLKRSPATRIAMSPAKSSKRIPFKNAVKDAFRGESSTVKKQGSSFPLVNITGLLDRESITDVPHVRVSDSYGEGISPNSYSKQGRKLSALPSGDDFGSADTLAPLPTHGRRRSRTNVMQRLSTIASVDPSSTLSSTNQSLSQVSKTTMTQGATIGKHLARDGHGKPGLKRRLTKHSDLLSVLSLPDSAPSCRAGSIRSARSVRTTRRRLDKANIQDIMREVADDECKYVRELKTLVDGVIPVLLTCVLSKSKVAEAAGLFNPNNSDSSDTALTQPIVDMGVALEQLKGVHQHVPVENAEAFTAWALRAHRIYADYTNVWRLGFQDIVVNLAPACHSSSTKGTPTLEGLPRNNDGDLINTNGERVDVAFLLKRPIARIRYLTKATKGVAKLKRSDLADKTASMYESLLEKARQRCLEEEANLEDRLANNVDATRARDPRTMALVENAQINSLLKVIAKDYFSLAYQSSGGQRIECRIELILRGDPSGRCQGDVLVCSVDDFSRYLLFAPIPRNLVSTQVDIETKHLLAVIRGPTQAEDNSEEWHEVLDLEAEVSDTAAEWVEMLGIATLPHNPTAAPDLPAPRTSTHLTSKTKAAEIGNFGRTFSQDLDIPIGARRRRATRATATKRAEEARPKWEQLFTSAVPELLEEPKRSYERQFSPITPIAGEGVRPEGDKLSYKTTRHSRDYRKHPSLSPRVSPSATVRKLVNVSSPFSNEEPRGEDRAHESYSMDLPYVSLIREDSNPGNEETRPSHQTPDYDPLSQMGSSSINTHSVTDEGSLPPPAPRRPSHGLVQPIHFETPSTHEGCNVRTPSPLKHEYQLSNASDTSAESELCSSSDEESSSDSSEEEIEAANVADPENNTAGVYSKQLSRSASIYSLPNTSLALSRSGGNPAPRISDKTKNIIATVSCWSDAKGKWEDLWDGPCSILISPGLIAAYEMSASHFSKPEKTANSTVSSETTHHEAGADFPLIAQVLTPCVPLRQSTVIDIEVKSPPTRNSRLKSSVSIRYRALNTVACGEMYQAIHKARLENIIYKRLEAERTLAGYGRNPYEKVVQRRRWPFGRHKGYRAHAHESIRPIGADDGRSAFPLAPSSAPSFLRRFGRGSFNIARSSVGRNSPGVEGLHDPSFADGTSSLYTSSSFSGITRPLTPSTPSMSLSGTQVSRWSLSGSTPVDLGSSNLKIRLYGLETSSKWNDTGMARLTITTPPSGMQQESSLYQGIERRVLVSRKPVDVDKLPDHSIQDTNDDVVFDRILGGNCFSKIGRTGICVNVWEDVRGPNGEVGMVGAVGGVSGRTRKWCFQAASSYDANWIFNLVAVRRFG